MNDDTMVWVINGTEVVAPAGLLPEGILGGPDDRTRKLAAARRYDRRRRRQRRGDGQAHADRAEDWQDHPSRITLAVHLQYGHDQQ